MPLKVPALKDRREDVPALAQQFIIRSAENAGMQSRELSADTLAALQAYDWPGNVRQLRNLMDWLLIMAPGGAVDPIRADMLPPEIGANAPALLNIDPTADIMGLPLREARDLFETQYLQAQLLRFRRQYQPHRAVRRDGAQCPSPQAEAIRGQLRRKGGWLRISQPTRVRLV